MCPLSGRNVFLSISGPERKSNDPLVLVVGDMGDGCLSWKAFQRLAAGAGLARVMNYDRPGLGRSEPSPEKRTAETMARELDELLHEVHLSGPFIVVTHSYGGIIAREFLARRPDDIRGMVFVDAEQEDSYKVMDVPWDALFSVLGDLDYYEVTGLNDEHKLQPEEWKTTKADSERTKPISDAESAVCDVSCDSLREKRQIQQHILGHRPVAVLKGNSLQDYQRIYDAGVAAGNGTEHERELGRGVMERLRTVEGQLQRAILGLPNNHRFSTVDTEHNV